MAGLVLQVIYLDPRRQPTKFTTQICSIADLCKAPDDHRGLQGHETIHDDGEELNEEAVEEHIRVQEGNSNSRTPPMTGAAANTQP